MGSLRPCQDLNLFTVLIGSACFLTKHAISVMVSVLNLASRLLFGFALEETRELNTLLRKHFATFCNCLLAPKRKCRVDHNTRSSHLARCESQQLRAHVTAAANITCFGLLRAASSFAAVRTQPLVCSTKNTCGALGRSNTLLMTHVHEENRDAMLFTVTSSFLMREAPIFASMNFNGVSQRVRGLLRHGHLAQDHSGSRLPKGPAP